MKQLCSFVLIMTISTAIFCQNRQKISIYFDTDKYDLKEKDRDILDAFSKNIPSLIDYSIEILAHTDSRGSESYNQALANRRAKSVETYLAEKGIIISKVEVNSLGESRPKFSNNNELGRQQNRRVDIIIQPIKKAKVSEARSIFKSPILSQLRAEKRETFTFQTDRENVIEAKEGTIITIPPDVFEYKNGSNQPIGEVTVSIEEAYTFGDMIMLNLTTTSDGRMLETGGMIHIEASSNGQALKIKEGKSFNIKMPVIEAQPEMELFIGEENGEDNSVNWKETKKPFEVGKLPVNYTKNAIKPNEKRELPVVLNENGTVNQSATDTLRDTRKDLIANGDYVPFYEDHRVKTRDIKKRKGKPLKMGYIPEKMNQAWEEHWKINPEKINRKKVYKPKELKKPNRADVKYNNMSFIGKLRLGKKKVEAKKDEIYKKQMKYYQIKLEKYNNENALYKRYLRIVRQDQNKLYTWENKKRTLFTMILRNMFWDDEFPRQASFMRGVAKEIRISNLEKKFKETGRLNNKELRYYVMDVNQMGLINCDRFLSFPLKDREMITVKPNFVNEARTMVVVHRYKSILGLKSIGSIHKSDPVPNDIDITILSFYTRNGQFYLAKKITKTGEQDVFELDYQPVSLSEFKKELEI